MELNSKQMEFVTLRADGLSFDKIAKQLKISKATLIQWSKLFEDNIKVEISHQCFHPIHK